MKKTFHVTLFLLTIMVLSCVISNCRADELQSASPKPIPTVVGLKVGDQFTYNSTISLAPGVSLNSLDTASLNFFNNQKELAWFKLTVTNVSGSIVCFDLLFHNSNGTEHTEFFNANLDSGVNGAFPYMFSSSLNVGNPLYVNPTGELRSQTAKVDETITQQYAGGNRLTNHVKTLDYSITLWSKFDNLYFDKETGILVQETNSLTINGSKPHPFTATASLIQSNVWSVGSQNQAPEFPMAVLLIVVLAAVSLLLIVRKTRFKGND